MEPQVVVNIKCNVFEHVNDGVVSVRFAPFGLTAYGDTEDEAVGEFKKLFNRFITAYREKGRLEDVLNRSAVEWWWEKDYPKHMGDYEHTGSESSVSATAAERMAVMNDYQMAWQQRPTDVLIRDFAVAA